MTSKDFVVPNQINDAFARFSKIKENKKKLFIGIFVVLTMTQEHESNTGTLPSHWFSFTLNNLHIQ